MPVNKNSKLTKTDKPGVKAKRLSPLSVDVFDTKGKKVGTVGLPEEIFKQKSNNSLMAQAVRVYLANQRQGTSSTKTRGEVRGSTRKIYRQKGTGRARHGSLRAPIFVHGGIAFGPKPRDFSLKLSSKMKQKALFSALSSKLLEHEIRVVKGLDTLPQKTKEIVKMLENLGLYSEKRKILLVLPEDIEHVFKASRNIEGVHITTAARLNTYEVLDHAMLLFMDEAVKAMQKQYKGGT